MRTCAPGWAHVGNDTTKSYVLVGPQFYGDPDSLMSHLVLDSSPHLLL